ncbi:MAG: nucleotidyltransferase domain-containing protein [Candidatus Bathyarchaeota archaeon]|nr:MAG: nucleotidyltransferase domain-containing protein [Candidatus Bathyarchaeota archaeon]
MKHNQILEQLLAKAKSDPNTLGFLVFGSVASGTHHEKSDIDVMTVLLKQEPSSGIENTVIDGIKVGNLFFTYQVLTHSIDTVPYLLHPLGNAKLLFDRENTIKPLLGKIKDYFDENPEIEDEWNQHYGQLKEEKMQFGYEKTTIIDVWNELEKRHSGGKIKRFFFNSFYLTNARIFSLLKRFL